MKIVSVENCSAQTQSREITILGERGGTSCGSQLTRKLVVDSCKKEFVL